jgi:hypothetical protein
VAAVRAARRAALKPYRKFSQAAPGQAPGGQGPMSGSAAEQDRAQPVAENPGSGGWA